MTSAVTPERATNYWLARHVHLCATPAGMVFLDLRRDAYLVLGAAHARLLEPIVPGWPAQSLCSSPVDSRSPAVTAVAEMLVSRGLLTNRECEGRNANPVSVRKPVEPLYMLDWMDAPQLRLIDVLRFLGSCARAMWFLRARGLEKALEQVAQRKTALARARRPGEDRLALDLARRFRELRIWLFAADGHCLFHALALTNFLCCYGLHATLVIGVRTDRWGAHSWVQLDDLVLDSTPEKALFYAPIVAV